MVDPEYDIQNLVELSGVPRRTIYFYTQQGIIPPPRGAGLAARYGEVHLLRLRLIPVLRRQGLRLDEIRRQLEVMQVDVMRQRLAEVPQPAFTPSSMPLPDPVSSPNGRAFVHYPLPGGCTLVAPADLNAEMQRKLNQLIAVAQQILNPKGLYIL